MGTRHAPLVCVHSVFIKTFVDFCAVFQSRKLFVSDVSWLLLTHILCNFLCIVVFIVHIFAHFCIFVHIVHPCDFANIVLYFAHFVSNLQLCATLCMDQQSNGSGYCVLPAPEKSVFFWNCRRIINEVKKHFVSLTMMTTMMMRLSSKQICHQACLGSIIIDLRALTKRIYL